MEQTIIGDYKVTVINGCNGTQLFITDADGIQVYAHRLHGDPMERARQVINALEPAAVEAVPVSREIAEVPQSDLQTAYSQVLAEKVMFCDEKEAVRWVAALDKAIKEIELNQTIKFIGNVLSFKSRETKKDRITTKFGCYKTCDCKGELSYHLALYAIMKRRAELQTERAAKTAGGCSCKFDWDSKFYERRCPEHLSQMFQTEAWA